MLKVVGFRKMNFVNSEGEQVNLVNLHYTDDAIFGDFKGVSTGHITLPPGLIEGLDFLDIGCVIEIKAKVSKRGNAYKYVEIVG